MIIGVDESGSFSNDSRVLLAAALMRPSAHERIAEALQVWERRTRVALGLTNEVKGRDLDEAASGRFVADVLRAGGDDAVVYMAFAVDVCAENIAAMDIQRQVLMEGYHHWADMQAQSNDPARQRFARQLTQTEDWVGARSPRQLLKLMTLSAILPTVVENAFGFSIAREFGGELVEFRVHLDRGYIKRSEVRFWRDLLRNIFIGETEGHPIPFSTEWAPDHPVLQTFVDQQSGTGFVLKPTFKERIDFCDSATTPVVRLADVITSIVRRGAHGGDLARPYRELRSLCLDRYAYKVLVWNDKRRPPRPNPYLEFNTAGGL